MAEEFLCHRNGSEWWYCTGYLNDKAGHMFSFQFTLARVRIFGFQFNILMTALTDFETGKHYYAQKPIFFGKDVIITPEKVGLDGLAEMIFAEGRPVTRHARHGLRAFTEHGTGQDHRPGTLRMAF